MGGRETGGLASLLPGYRKVASAEDRAEVRRFWNSPGIAPEPGLAATELVEALEERRIKVLWIVATNPVVSQPDAGRFAAALKRADLVICQDAYFPTETAALAHVLLPAAQWPEKDGTMTNSERRVSLVADARSTRPARRCRTGRSSPASAARSGIARRSRGAPRPPCTPSTSSSPKAGCATRAGISHTRLQARGSAAVAVPERRPPRHRAAVRRRRFATPDGRARLAPTPHTAPADAVTPDFPLVLTTGRVAQQWHTMTRTGKSPSLLEAEPHPYLELHPDDAAAFEDGEKVRVRSRRGSATLRVRISDAVPPGRRLRALPLGRAAPGGRARAR